MKEEPSITSEDGTSGVLRHSPVLLGAPRGLGEDAEWWMYGFHGHQHLLLHIGLC